MDISRETIVKAAEGDVGAFEEIYRAYFSFVANVAMRVVSSRDDANEIAQEVFMSIYRNLKNFRFESSLKTWIYRATINSAINYSKKFSKHNRQRVELTENLGADNHHGVHENADKEYNKRMIASLLNALNPDQKACIILRNLEGLSYQDIAETLAIPINTVRSRIKRARETMLALQKEVAHNEL